MIKPKLLRPSFNTIRKLLTFLMISIIIFAAGFALGSKKPELSPLNVTVSREIPADKNLDFSLFWAVWDTLEQDYYDHSKVVPANMIYGAIKGMVNAVGDPYTTFLNPRENEVVQEDLNGNFEGVGIQIGFRGTQLAVVAPLPGSPAEKANVQSGDFIVGIKDESKNLDRNTVGISLPEAVQAIRGPAGTTVTLALVREGVDELIIVDIIRESINIPSLILSFVGEDESIAHLQLLKFGGETVQEWDQAVLEILKKSSLKGVIIDVRNNSGGYLQASVDIASDFLDQNQVVVIEEKSSGQKEEYLTSRYPRLNRLPVVILVNQGSASASEILAAALRDQHQTKLVGETTFGKGTIQEPRQVDGAAALHITVAKWLTPNETWINETGLEPDVKIEDNPETAQDEQLDKAIELINNY